MMIPFMAKKWIKVVTAKHKQGSESRSEHQSWTLPKNMPSANVVLPRNSSLPTLVKTSNRGSSKSFWER